MKGSTMLALPLALLAGCGHPPVLSLADRVCDKAPALVPGNDVTLGRESGRTVVVDATSPCVETPAGRASYAVFALPDASSPYRITVRSRPQGTAIIAPSATIYAADDRPRRTIDGFRAAAGTLVASATGQPGDRYVVVASTPATVGGFQVVPTAAAAPPVLLAATVIVPIVLPASPVGPTTDAFKVVLAHSGAITVSAIPFVTMP